MSRRRSCTVTSKRRSTCSNRKDKFAMKELGQARHILGMRIERNQMTKTLWLSQFDYIQKVLKHFNIDNVKPTITPLLTTIWLSDRDSPSTEEERNLFWKDILRIGSRKYHVRNGSDPTWSCICHRGRQPVHVKPRTKALGGCQTHP